MRKNSLKKVALAILCGGTMLSGCLGLNVTQLLWAGAVYTAAEWTLDGGLFDLFPDGPAATE